MAVSRKRSMHLPKHAWPRQHTKQIRQGRDGREKKREKKIGRIEDETKEKQATADDERKLGKKGHERETDSPTTKAKE